MVTEKLRNPVTLAAISLTLGALIVILWSITPISDGKNAGNQAERPESGTKQENLESYTSKEKSRGQKRGKSGASADSSTIPSSIPAKKSPVELLKASVMGADAEAKGQEVLEARRLLAKILRNHPEWALELAKMLPDLKNRALSFQIARLLGAHLEDQAVRKTLLDLARQSESDLARETAIQALTGLRNDEEARLAIRNAFEDNQANNGVRSSASFALREVIDEFSRSDQALIRRMAEDQVSSSQVHESIRVESLDLLDVNGNPEQKQLAYDILNLKHQASPSMALAAARVLLSAGEKSERIFPLLKQLAQQSLKGPEAKVLEAMLKDQSPGSNR